ncbi:hypothetical protein [Dactylosporangium salmoneum]|uniref:Uncharacterized protein n=1 Tax=Dactylosporangium salmoneum TaxID=53361 RepID=A0ABP5T4R4_9ACTN
MSLSLAADRDFTSWAQEVRDSGCGTGPHSQAYYDSAQQQSRNTADAKGVFLETWNPVAARYGLRARSSNDI